MTRTVLSRLDLRGATDLAGALARPTPPPTDDDDALAVGARHHRRRPRARRRRAARAHRALRRLRHRRPRVSPRRRSTAALDARRARAPRRARRTPPTAIRAYHAAQVRRPEPALDRDGIDARGDRASRSTAPGSTCRVGAPPYPSTVLMTAIPAQVAGRRARSCCACRPAPTGACPTPTLAAAALVGVDEVYRVGGAQAIAALAYGTEIDPPGRRDRRARQRVRRRWPSARSRASSGIDSLAGPVGGRGRGRRHAPGRVRRRRPRWPRPSTARAAPRSSSRGTTTWPTRSTPRSSELVADAPAPRRDRSHAARRRPHRARRRRRRRRWTSVNADRARAPRARHRRRRRARSPLVRNAGAVFVGPWAPAALGDYVAGREPRAPDRPHRALRQRAARRHVPQAHARRPRPTASGARDASPPHVDALAAAEGLDAHAALGSTSDARRRGRTVTRREPRRSRRATTCARSRATTRRSSTCRCGSTPTRARSRRRRSSSTRWLDELRAVAAEPLPRPRRARRCATRSARTSASRRSALFCANGSNEVLQTLLLTYGGPGPARRSCSSPPTRCTRTSPASPAPRWSWASGAPTSRSTPTPRARSSTSTQPDDRVRVQPQQPDRHGRATRPPSRRCSTPTPTASSSSTRRTASSRRGARSSSCATTAASSSCARTRRCGRWPRCGSASRSRRRGSSSELEKVVLPYHLAVGHADRGHGSRSSFATEMDDRVASARRRARAAARRARERRPASPCSRRAPTSCCSGVHGDGHALWERARRPRRARARLLAAGPASTDCLRVTVGTPDENDAFLDAPSATSLREVAA